MKFFVHFKEVYIHSYHACVTIWKTTSVM